MNFEEETIEKSLNTNEINTILDLLLSIVERIIEEDYSKNKQEFYEHEETQRDQNVSSSKTSSHKIRNNI